MPTAPFSRRESSVGDGKGSRCGGAVIRVSAVRPRTPSSSSNCMSDQRAGGGHVPQLADRVSLPNGKSLYVTILFNTDDTFEPLNTFSSFPQPLLLVHFGISQGNRWWIFWNLDLTTYWLQGPKFCSVWYHLYNENKQYRLRWPARRKVTVI